jgi:hypothetical protein
MADYWTDRALPVLHTLAMPSDDFRDGFLSLGRGRAEANLGIELSDDAVEQTILQLDDLGYVEFRDVTPEAPFGVHFAGLKVTGRGMQALGEWPRFEALISPLTFAALLEQLADFAGAEEQSAIRRAAAVVRRLSGAALRSLVLGTGGQLLRNFLGSPI